jgi:HSP20 family protein
MKEQETGMRTAKEAMPIRLATLEDIFRDMKESFDTIARRAYEIFESNGRQFGRDMEDWLRAEHEMLHPVHLEISETGEAVKVRAEVPGFTEKDLEISVEPRRLTIAGKRESKKEEKKEKTVYSEWRSDQLFRCVELPADVEAEKVKATLKDGVLELLMPKSTSARKIRIEPKAA